MSAGHSTRHTRWGSIRPGTIQIPPAPVEEASLEEQLGDWKLSGAQAVYADALYRDNLRFTRLGGCHLGSLTGRGQRRVESLLTSFEQAWRQAEDPAGATLSATNLATARRAADRLLGMARGPAGARVFKAHKNRKKKAAKRFKAVGSKLKPLPRRMRRTLLETGAMASLL